MNIKTLEVDGIGPAIHAMRIPGYEQYCIYDSGVVVDLKTSKQLSFDCSSGKPRVSLSQQKNNLQRVYVDRLLYTLFMNTNIDNMEIWHLDGNLQNNQINNLLPVTKEEYKQRKKKLKNQVAPQNSVPITGHPEYACDESGKIYGKKGQALKGHIDRNGYVNVLLTENSKTKNYLAHRLIIETFKPDRDPNKTQVNHINGVKTDNRIQNLEWCTRSENLLHAYETKLERKMIGVNHWRHKFTEETVSNIRMNCKPRVKGLSIADFARKYSCNQSTISKCLKGETYNEY